MSERPKVAAVAAARLTATHPVLSAVAHECGMNDYCQERGYERPFFRVITGSTLKNRGAKPG